jgi:hypothetical protein
MKPYKQNYFRMVVAFVSLAVGVLFWETSSSLPLILSSLTLFNGERIAENTHDIDQLKEILSENKNN